MYIYLYIIQKGYIYYSLYYQNFSKITNQFIIIILTSNIFFNYYSFIYLFYIWLSINPL